MTRDLRTQVLRVRFTSAPQGDGLHKGERVRFAAVVLYPAEVKRRLATREAATARAVELARAIIRRDCYRPPDLDALACAVEVTVFDLEPFTGAEWIQEDGTKVWITEAEQPLPFGWAWRR